MNYAKIKKYDTSNWDGINTAVFFSGCRFHCPECFNYEAQDFDYGTSFGMKEIDLIVEYVKDSNVDGLCILGGEPFQQNLLMLYSLVRRVKMETGKPIHMWTGYTWEELMMHSKERSILRQVDTLVDGRFEIDKKDLGLKYRGSSNQRVIDVQKSLTTGNILDFII